MSSSTVVVVAVVGIVLVVLATRPRRIRLDGQWYETDDRDVARRLHALRGEVMGMLADVRERRALRRIVLREAARGTVGATLDKRVVSLCLRSASGAWHPRARVRRVLVHELAHVLSASHGHSDEFRRREAALLDAAERAGLRIAPHAPHACD